jgi:diguanylate cyclase
LETFGEGTNLFFVGLGCGLLVLLMGAGIGYWAGRGNAAQRGGSGLEQRRILNLLHELGAWTHEYRGGVNQYQQELSAISSQAAKIGDQPGTAQVLPLVEQIMQTNQQLQSRLDAAEKQLADQTERIESYLSEARTDSLTGLANRRAFDKKLDELFNSFLRGGPTFVLALVDIDHFKNFNDTYGHQTGDHVLRHVAQKMQREIPGALQVARFGGEEFAVLLESPLKVAAGKMETFRRACADETIESDGRQLTVTVSVGVSETRQDQIIGPLVRRADEALYAAKGIGRNRTYYHDGSAPSLFGAPDVVGTAKT